ncbi:hypothetical protein BDB01DRAFT_896313 [Pilobolus umbonatus]|nr:hypothetical protein BDB01DRAFT_896313 [Pilobolus umbonatus]
MNTHILSSTPSLNLGMDYTKYHFEEVDHALDNYAEMTDFKSYFGGNRLIPSPEVSPCVSEEESDSSLKASSNNKPSRNNPRRRDAKSTKKDDDSDNDSLHEVIKPRRALQNKKSHVSLLSSNSITDDDETDPTKKQKNLYKTEMCRNWEETGHCRYGIKCQYAHGADDLREIERHPKYKTQKCRTFHQTGACPYGSRCTFRHFNLPGDYLEMRKLDEEEEREMKELQLKKEEEEGERRLKMMMRAKKSMDDVHPMRSFSSSTCQSMNMNSNRSLFSKQNDPQQWLLETHFSTPLPTSTPSGNFPSIRKRNTYTPVMYDPEDALLPSNAESLLPHQLLFDLESPDENKDLSSRCPLRSYASLPSFSNFHLSQQQQQHHHQQLLLDRHLQSSNPHTLFRPLLF